MKALRRIFPAKERLLLDGGKNSKFERSIIANNESPDCANVVFSQGAVETRQGAQKLNTTPVGSFAIDSIYTRRGRDTNQTMCAIGNGTMYTLAGTTFSTVPSAQSVWTAGTRVGATQYENHLFLGNGASIPYKYNGTDFTRHAVYPPTSTMTVASQAVGVLTGDYRYKLTYVNSALVESDVGPITATFTAASATLRVSNIPVAPQSFGVSTRRIYRNSTATSGSYFRVATLNDNTTTTYDDNNADTALGALAPTNKGVLPNYSVCQYHQNRIFMNDPSEPTLVKWTDLGEPYTMNTLTNFQQVGDDSSDLVKGFGVYDNSIIVFCENSLTICYMPSTDPTTWKWVVSRSPYGSKSPYGVVSYKNKLLFPAIQNSKFVGFASFSGDTIEPTASLLSVSSAGSDLTSDRIEPDMFNFLESAANNISAITYKNKIYVTLAYGSSASNNNRIYVYDFGISNLSKKQEASWVPWTGTVMQASQFTIYGGNLYFGSAQANGYVYKLESGTYNDDGAAINSYLWTKEFSGFENEEAYSKDFRTVTALIENSGDWFMNLGYRVDSDTGDGNSIQIDLDPGGSLWGAMMWGRDMWGGGSLQREINESLGNARGKRIQFKFSNQNTINQKFKVHGLKFSYNLKGYR